MADDIDIEEHDVLDNPRIKTIFPDITCIKTEVIDYEDEDINDFDEESYEAYQREFTPEYLEDVPSLYQNKIIVGSKPCESTSSEEEEEEPEILECSVVLEDWGDSLKNNPCFCSDCEILFPTENALDSHKMTVHSFLVAVGRNKAIKSTTKSSIAARLQFETDSDMEISNLCNHCNMVFPDEISFLKHSYELLTRKFSCSDCNLEFESEISLQEHLKKHPSALVYCCPVCSCSFKLTKKLFSHMLYQHQVDMKKAPQRVKTTYKCRYCPKFSRDNKSYNNHIHYFHPELYKKIGKDKNHTEKFECQPCNLTFPTAYSEKIHRVSQHVKSETYSKSVDLDRHIKIESPKITQSVLKQEFIQRPVPKSTLFKCSKCQIHFVSSLVALEHTKRCALKKGNWKCKTCRIPFRLVDRHVHTIQHNWTDRFKILTVHENMLNRILCRCVSCKVCSDERTLMRNHERGCAKGLSFLCNMCNLNIHEKALTKHMEVHNEMDSESFVVVDFVNFDQSTLSSTIAIKPTLKNLESKKPVKEYKNFKLYYYCPTCHCYMKVNKISDKHNIGKCKRHLIKRHCKLCGLTFSIKCLATHMKAHKKFPRLKLKDLAFKSTQSGRKVNPPPPNFTKCVNCEVKFFSTVAINNHVCNGDDAKICGYCGDMFSDLAYKLHVPFHEYAGERKTFIKNERTSDNPDKGRVFENIPELIKKYDSLKIIWNILFRCETCDTIFDDYDDVVEHSQDHFCNMESYNVTINHCSTCDLKLVGKSYEKHIKLHSAKTINKNSFKIIPFKYDILLTDGWYDIFKTLAKDRVDQILKKSKYKHTRGVRMHTSVDGLVDLTLYRCSVCETIIDWHSIEEHARNANNCSDSIKFNCNSCHLNFASKYSLLSHEYSHDESRARIVSFNHQGDIDVNVALRSKMKPESLKFIRCQHCGKLINKAKYKKHALQHKYYERSKTVKKKIVKNQPNFLIRPKFVKVDTTAVHKFYKCRKCSVCVFKNNIQKHFCSLKSQKSQCPKCHLWFRSSHLPKHLMYHDTYKLTKNNVIVYTFKNGKIEKERSDKVVLHQCADCSVCLHRAENIKRHICLRSNYQKICDLCEMPFHCSRTQLHRRFHEDKNFSKKDVIIKKFNSLQVLEDDEKQLPKPSPVSRKHTEIFKKTKPTITEFKPSAEMESKEFLRFVHLRFYKCRCKLLFVTSELFLEHVNSCENDRTGVICDKCGLMFHKSSIDLHKNINKCPSKSTNIYIVTLINVPLTYDNTRCFYSCYKCNINYVTFRAAMHHIESNHVVKLNPYKCDVCGVLFSYRSYLTHQQMHHTHRNLTLDDINRFTVIDMDVMSAIKDAPGASEVEIVEYVASETPIDERKSIKRKLVIEDTVSKQIKLQPDLENSIDNYTYELYPCKTCDLNFLSKKTLKRHLFGSHDEKQMKCSECDLNFTQNSLTRHLRKHHNNPRYSNYHLNYSVYAESYVTSEINEDAIATEERVEERATEERVEERATEERVEERATEKQQQETNNRTTNKLYKCNECDVYYLVAEACRDHVANHAVLDPTEYIACKICDLQFLCENLGSHMKCHREKTFNIDEIIVEEYQLKDGAIKIDSYPAVDRLKSKLVTTTTHFDTEDEKNDESTIDSTISLNDNKSDLSDKSNTIVSNVERKSNESEKISNFFFSNETDNR